ncbi:hypothetical protein C0J52_01909 [Blattella germanica]|nr:hypothetical protein C0J52_01909 [Blattella germanica]
MSEPKIFQIVESILPTIEEPQCICIEETESSEPEVVYQTVDENGFICARQHGSIVMASDHSNNCYPYTEIVDEGKRYSSTTIVGAGNDAQVPVEAITEAEEIQSVQVADYATVQENQPMVIASTDSQGNCFVAVQENQVNMAAPNWNQKKPPQRAPYSRLRTTMCPERARGFVHYGRSRMIADKYTSIPVAEFKKQLSDSSDTLGKLELAPSSKKLMRFISTKKKLFAIPGHVMCSPHHRRLYTRHLVQTQTPEETFDDMALKPLGYQPEVDPSKIKRITRRRRYPEAEEYQRRIIQEQIQQTFNNLVAESQKNMEAVILENSGTLMKEDHGNLQILVQAAESDSLENEGRSNAEARILTKEDDSSCVEENVIQHEDENLHEGEWLGAVQQFIIIVPSDPLEDSVTETVVTS